MHELHASAPCLLRHKCRSSLQPAAASIILEIVTEINMQLPATEMRATFTTFPAGKTSEYSEECLNHLPIV